VSTADAQSTAAAAAAARGAWDVDAVRADFPILASTVNGHPLVYLDNAATAQKPRAVIEATAKFYREDNANIHRGVHALSQRATEDYERSRRTLAAFIGAPEPESVVFVRGATEGINLIANSFAQWRLKAGDTILLTGMEHHANIVPWQLLRDRIGIRIVVVPVLDSGELDMPAFHRLLEGERPALVACVHASNALGTINPVRAIIDAAHARSIPVLLDAAQSAPHFRIDVSALDCDFLVLSGHKLFGPTGIGLVYGRRAFMDAMPPYQGGGDMISRVSFDKTTYKASPEKFEAGTPNIAGVIGFAAAVDYLESLNRSAAEAHEQALLRYASERLRAIPGLRIIGQAREKVSVISFLLDEVHPHDIGTFLDVDGIAIRAGHHCTQPLMDHFHVPGTARASFAFYNTFDEVDRLVAGIEKIRRFFA